MRPLRLDADDHARRLEDCRRRLADREAEALDALVGHDRGDLRAARADRYFEFTAPVVTAVTVPAMQLRADT